MKQKVHKLRMMFLLLRMQIKKPIEINQNHVLSSRHNLHFVG